MIPSQSNQGLEKDTRKLSDTEQVSIVVGKEVGKPVQRIKCTMNWVLE